MTDKELERIYNEGYRAVYWTAMQLLKSEADAEDVVQDTFVALIESYDTINDKDKVIPWLKKIAANKCLNRLTRTKTDAVEDEFFEDVEAMPEDFLPDTIIESEEARRIVMDIIDNSLSDDIRRTLILFYFDEMSTKEIAKSLGVPEGTVRRRLNFARNKIKKEVEKYEKDNKTKLFGMALPFLSKLFIKEAEQVPFKAMPAKLISLSASAQATHAGAASKIALTGAKKGTGIMLNKVIIATVASVVVVGGVIAGIVVLNNRENVPTTEETTVITEVTEDSAVVSNATTDTTTSETDISVSDTTALSSRTMRELTDDDLNIKFNHVNTWAINPYLRYTFVKVGNFSAFLDGGIEFASQHAKGYKKNLSTFGVSVKPGIAYNVSDKVTLVAHLGDGLYYAHKWNKSFEGDTKYAVQPSNNWNKFGFQLLNGVSFGAYYNF